MDAARKRCQWVSEDPEYIQYHDEDWGVPVHDDRKWFEMLTLEGAQAGLSWLTILRKRAAYQEAFDDFDPEVVARYDEDKVQALLQNPGIVRNRLKIRSTVTNAQAFLTVQGEFGSFDTYIWAFVDGQPVINHWPTLAEVPAETSQSKDLSKDLKKRGFRFVGPTIVYALMQSCGMVMDHTIDCFRYDELTNA